MTKKKQKPECFFFAVSEVRASSKKPGMVASHDMAVQKKNNNQKEPRENQKSKKTRELNSAQISTRIKLKKTQKTTKPIKPKITKDSEETLAETCPSGFRVFLVFFGFLEFFFVFLLLQDFWNIGCLFSIYLLILHDFYVSKKTFPFILLQKRGYIYLHDICIYMYIYI